MEHNSVTLAGNDGSPAAVSCGMKTCWSLEIWLQISSRADNVNLGIKDGVYEDERGGRRIHIEGI